MLDLQARIDLQKRDRSRGAQQELDSARTDVACLRAHIACRLMDALALFITEEGCGGFFHQLLVTPLQRAIACAEHDDIAVRIGDHLRFDVTRPIEELFNETLATAEGSDRFAHRGLVQFGYLVEPPCDLHAATATAKGRLDGDRQAVLLGKGHDLLRVARRLRSAGHQRCTDSQCDLARLHLVTQRLDCRRWRADPLQARANHGLGKSCAF
ncbi:hypothetical protein D3C75_750200 [compost metagenome]